MTQELSTIAALRKFFGMTAGEAGAELRLYSPTDPKTEPGKNLTREERVELATLAVEEMNSQGGDYVLLVPPAG